MANFITNKGSGDLKERLIELITKSEELKFLVGFFYFSGIRELYDGIKNNNSVSIKILVGMNVDKSIFGLSEYGTNSLIKSDDDKTIAFLDSVKKSISVEDLDNQDFYEQIKYFLSLLESGRLVLRKTYNPNHSKLYLFKLQSDQVGKRELFITGSSNLTKAGILTQEEFNVEIGDYGFKDAEKYFDKLWNEAVRISEDDVIRAKLVEILSKKAFDISP